MSIDVAYFGSLNLAVTGHKGYIGKALCLALKSSGHVYIVIDIGKIEYLDVLIHLAAKVDNTATAYINNITIDLEIIELCKQFRAHLLYASTNNVYPYSRDCDLKTHTKINDFYSASKIHAEEIIQRLFSVNATIFRFGDVFGPGQKHGNLFKAIEISIVENKPLCLYGRGLKIRNYIYLKDLIMLFQIFVVDKCYAKHCDKVYNISYDEPLTTREIIEYVAIKSGLSIEIVEMSSHEEKLDFRTISFAEIDGYKFNFDTWSALDDYVSTIQQLN